MNLIECLIWLATSGGSVLAVSWLLEQWGWYQVQSPKRKRNLFFIFSALVAIAAYCVLSFVPAEILNAVAPFFQIIYGTFVVIYLGADFHTVTKRNLKIY